MYILFPVRITYYMHAADTWLKYCRYGVKRYKINQSINITCITSVDDHIDSSVQRQSQGHEIGDRIHLVLLVLGSSHSPCY